MGRTTYGRATPRYGSVAADVSTVEGGPAIASHAVATFGRLDVLVNMASIYRSRAFDEVTPDWWDADLDVNLRSVFLCAKACVPAMRKAGGGRIVNFADWLARSGRPNYPGFTPYYTAKAGVIGLTEALALELATDQILVNAIAPGPILAPPDMSQEEIAEVAAATPLGRWGGEIEIAKAVLFLCRDGLHHRRDDPRRRGPASGLASPHRPTDLPTTTYRPTALLLVEHHHGVALAHRAVEMPLHGEGLAVG